MTVFASGLLMPEGPIAQPDGGLILVEVLGGRLSRLGPDGVRSTIADLGGGPNGAAIGPDGRIYVCNNGGFDKLILPDGSLMPIEAPLDTPPGAIQVVDPASGAFETLYASTEATPFWGPNDLVFDETGGFWFTDFGRDRGAARMRGGLYYAKADGSDIRLVAGPLDGANGVGLSPDGRTLYVALTYEAHLLRYRLSAPGIIDTTASPTPDGHSIVGRAGPGQFLDSLAVDSAGHICCASPGQGAILIFPPEGGTPQQIETGDFLTTNICFGGKDGRVAFVTLGSSGKVICIDWDAPGLPLAFG
ncbi:MULTISPECIES: SMP-30/gluconolactonase/LRE family protein [Sphingobium]|uniref:SMP-30/gluconolactonase/LRE family protein n=1 Tax=Sphingobium soli TaxID=1591116 RepID=A0ABS8H3G6_9SPHN|nr:MULTISPECIES: SMP-30/gluconolactonase/LRE family protein [Sphingobium]MCC4233094.1 SMP-30/gluconolactonase/LRE family protein [Sphingobium soli]